MSDPRIVNAAMVVTESHRKMVKAICDIPQALIQVASAVGELRDELEEVSKANVQQQEQIIGNLAGLREEIRRG